MRKRYIASAIGVVGAGALITYWLSDENNRTSIKNNLEMLTQKMMGNKEHSTTLEEAGIPDQVEKEGVAQMENSNMVSEGSQYGVNYYNEVQEEEDLDNEDSLS